MKPILITAFVAVISVFSYAAFSQDRQTPMASQYLAQKADASMEAKMAECFRRHGGLMEKPSVQNLRTCWRAHRHLMAA